MYSLYCTHCTLFIFPSLACLDIRWNDVGPPGVTALCNALKAGAVPLLHILNMGIVGAGQEGVRALADALASGNCSRLQVY
jgi:hypothetical protein